MGLKAVVGYWRHDTRLEYHRDAATLQEKTAEGNTVATLTAKQRLVISAADKLLDTYGPDKGYVFEPDNGLIIASSSVVAHDMVSLAWLLENRSIIPASERDGFIEAKPNLHPGASRFLVLGGATFAPFGGESPPLWFICRRRGSYVWSLVVRVKIMPNSGICLDAFRQYQLYL